MKYDDAQISGIGELLEVLSARVPDNEPVWFRGHADATWKLDCTRKNKKSPWDTLHPGRKWALASEELKTPAEIAADISDHLDAFPPIDEVDFKSLLLG
jgi:N-acetyl-anhydromuramyl-L-alanine amidase AmpD